jgi:hypothetical protein
MYSSFPKQDRVRIRLSLTFAWAFVTLGGFFGILNPTSVEAEIGFWLPLISSVAIAFFGTVATIGVALNKYWIEWVAAWFVSGGVFAYAIFIWYLSFSNGNGRFQAACLLTSLLFFFAYRIVACAAHARKLRLIHNLTMSSDDDGGP